LSFTEESETGLPKESPAGGEQEEDVEQVETDTESIGGYCFPLGGCWH